MTLEELLRADLREFADRPVEEPSEIDLRNDLVQADRRKIMERAAAALFALALAALLAWHLAPAVRNGPVRIEHHPTTETTIAIPRRAQAIVPPNVPSNGVTPGGLTPGSSLPPNPAVPVVSPAPGPHTPETSPGVKSPSPPPSSPPSSDFWAIASEASDGRNTPLLMVFGHAPAQHNVTVSSVLGAHTYQIDNQGDFRWTQKLSGKPPTFPVVFHVSCEGCGEEDLTVASYDPSPSQPGPDGSFSAFGREDDASGVFVIGGFVSLRGVDTVTLSSAYGNTQFDLGQNIYGGRVSLPNAPLHTPFVVTLAAGGQTVQLTLVRNT